MEKTNVAATKSLDFSVRVVRLCYLLQKRNKEWMISKQLARSGTAIGALISEGVYAQSSADLVNKLYVALKEANETDYWLTLLWRLELINDKEYESIRSDCRELIRILIASIKTLKKEVR